MMHHGHRGFDGHWLVNGGAEYPVPDGVKLGHCVSEDGWTPALTKFAGNHNKSSALGRGHYPFASETTFEFPLSSSALSLISRGPFSAGNVDVVTSPDQPKDKVTYRVTVRYFKEEIRDLAEVCSINRDEDDHGVGIFTPSGPRYPSRRIRDTLYFETLVVLPEPEGDSPLIVKKFETDVPNTVQRFADLNTKILFETLDIHGSNTPISVLSLAAIHGKIQTSSGPIRGVFNASDSLELRTSNSPIQVHVGLTSHDKSEPLLIMKTSNGALESEISLFSSSSSSATETTLTYHVEAKTSNSPLTINFATAPVGSTLDLDASTSNSPAKVSLHSTYEGIFNLSTSIFRPQVVAAEEVEDPKGKERKRTVTIDRINGHNKVDGKVFWGDEEKSEAEGVVKVHTSNSPLILKL